MKLWDETRRAT